MSSVQVDSSCCISWRTPNRNGVRSATFKVRNMECHFEYHKGREFGRDCDYRLYLVREGTPDKPFDLYVQVIIATDVVSRCWTTYPVKTEDGEYRPYSIIWKGHTSELSKVVADFEQQELLFRVTVPDDSTGRRTAEDKCTQTPLHSDTNLGIQSLSEDLSKLLDEDSKTDVELKCGDVTFKAHKNVLSARSKVFRAMLENDMREGKTGRVDIADTEADVLRQLLRYLYSGKLEELTMEGATRLYEVGDKYDVEALKRQCAIYLADNLSPDNACGILSLADHHTDSDLKEAAIAYIVDRKVPLQDDIWDDFCDEHPVLANKVFKRFCKLQASSK